MSRLVWRRRLSKAWFEESSVRAAPVNHAAMSKCRVQIQTEAGTSCGTGPLCGSGGLSGGIDDVADSVQVGHERDQITCHFGV